MNVVAVVVAAVDVAAADVVALVVAVVAVAMFGDKMIPRTLEFNSAVELFR